MIQHAVGLRSQQEDTDNAACAERKEQKILPVCRTRFASSPVRSSRSKVNTSQPAARRLATSVAGGCCTSRTPRAVTSPSPARSTTNRRLAARPLGSFARRWIPRPGLLQLAPKSRACAAADPKSRTPTHWNYPLVSLNPVRPALMTTRLSSRCSGQRRPKQQEARGRIVVHSRGGRNWPTAQRDCAINSPPSATGKTPLHSPSSIAAHVICSACAAHARGAPPSGSHQVPCRPSGHASHAKNQTLTTSASDGECT